MAEPKLELVKLSPTADSNLRWADGTLKGIKVLRWNWLLQVTGERKYGVQSPLHHAEWKEAKLVAENFYSGEQVRGEGGIHAIWPPQLRADAEDAGLEEFVSYAPRMSKDFSCLVSGWGRSVMGDVGWRAEFCRIRTIISPPRYQVRLFRQWCQENAVAWSVL